MTTPLNRRSFLARSLTALAAAPLLVKAALSQKPTLKSTEWTVDLHGQPPLHLFSMEVQGAAIKVPSNRHRCLRIRQADGSSPDRIRYLGEWDGTFKLERGCTNPAWILADLYERSGIEPDWVIKRHWDSWLYRSGAQRLLRPVLNWQMLYHWGVWCDEPVWHTIRGERSDGAARFAVNVVCHTQKDIDSLRETLRMHCLNWQSTDPRYRTSWPGVVYEHRERAV